MLIGSRIVKIGNTYTPLYTFSNSERFLINS